MMETYIYKIVPVDRDQALNPSPEIMEAMSQHFAYLKQALENGKLFLAGPCTNAAFGIAIFYADTPEEAQAFMDNDPAVKNNVMHAEFHPFRMSLLADDYKG